MDEMDRNQLSFLISSSTKNVLQKGYEIKIDTVSFPFRFISDFLSFKKGD